MKSLKEEASKVSFYLQRLTESAVLPEVQSAVTRKDRDAFRKVCKKAKIPTKYASILNDLTFTGPIIQQFPWPPLWSR